MCCPRSAPASGSITQLSLRRPRCRRRREHRRCSGHAVRVAPALIGRYTAVRSAHRWTVGYYAWRARHVPLTGTPTRRPRPGPAARSCTPHAAAPGQRRAAGRDHRRSHQRHSVPARCRERRHRTLPAPACAGGVRYESQDAPRPAHRRPGLVSSQIDPAPRAGPRTPHDPRRSTWNVEIPASSWFDRFITTPSWPLDARPEHRIWRSTWNPRAPRFDGGPGERRDGAAQWAIAGGWLDRGATNREDGSDDRQLSRRLAGRLGDRRAGQVNTPGEGWRARAEDPGGRPWGGR
jgi:hypothetical protein